MQIDTLKKLGFSDKSAKIYLALLSLGPSSVRGLAEDTGLNRGTVYDMLKVLQDMGVVSFYKEKTKQLFVAEHPSTLEHVLLNKERELSRLHEELQKNIPELTALYDSGGERPVARYFDADQIHIILEDVLETCATHEEKMYRIYSVDGLREYLYTDFPSFSDERIAKGITVRAIAVGEGGELRGLDERKWLQDSSAQIPSYSIMYPGKVAFISLNTKQEAVGLVIENAGVYDMQRILFDTVWHTL